MVKNQIILTDIAIGIAIYSRLVKITIFTIFIFMKKNERHLLVPNIRE